MVTNFSIRRGKYQYGMGRQSQIVFSSFLFAPALTQGQVIVDVSKITCDQYVHSKITTPNLIAAWLSGYYNAKRNNKVIDLETLEDNVSKVKNYCYDEKNFKVPIMKAVETVLGKPSNPR